MGTVHQFPVPRNPPSAVPAQDLARALRLAIDALVGADAPFAEREVAALALTNEATRLFLQSDLLAIADRHGDQVEVPGVIYQRHQPGTVRYFTLCGAFDLERWTYREMGVLVRRLCPWSSRRAWWNIRPRRSACGLRWATRKTTCAAPRRTCRPITGAPLA